MSAFLRQIVRRGALAAAILGLFGLAVSYLMQHALASQDVETNELLTPVVAALCLAAVGFALVALFELIAAGVQALSRKKLPPV